MARLYGWLSGDRGLAKTKPSNKQLGVKLAFERNGEDWRILTDNEIYITLNFDKVSKKVLLNVSYPKDVKTFVRKQS